MSAFGSIQGRAAHDAAISGNPVRLGGRAVNTDVAAVSNDDAVDLVTDLTGKQVVSVGAAYSMLVSGADTVDTSPTQVIAAGGAGFKLYIMNLLVTNGDADTGTIVKLTDGSGGATLWRAYAAAGGGGFAHNAAVPLFATTANTALYAQCETIDATVQVNASGYKGR